MQSNDDLHSVANHSMLFDSTDRLNLLPKEKAMKIDKERFECLKIALFETLKAHNLHPFMVKNDRHAWDVYHKAVSKKRVDSWIINSCDDSHIETALRKIFKS